MGYLVDAKGKWGPNWFVIGDFDDITCVEENRGGRKKRDASLEWFRNFIKMMGAGQILFSGCEFTSSNLRNDEERLDRAFGSPNWLITYPKATVFHIKRQTSEHCLLLLDSDPSTLKSKKRFNFDRRWIGMEGVDQVIESAWNTQHKGSPMFQVQSKIKSCRLELLIWSKGVKTNSAKTIEETIAKMEEVSKLGGQIDWAAWNALTGVLNKAFSSEEIFWKQKSRNRWLNEGDKNTKFFHACTVQRQKINAIERLVKSDGRVCESADEIEEEITGFYKKLFTSSNPPLFNTLLKGIPCSITPQKNQWLTRPVGEMEIKEALFDLQPNKAPGPDGMTPLFLQHYWNVVHTDICKAVKSFFSCSKMLKSVNHTLVTLVPKVKNPTSISHYRPISLCNTVYKIISKILANRLKPCLHNCICESQTAFVPGRQIIDNIIVAHECFHYLNSLCRSPKQFMALKLDMAKACDRVEWSFLGFVMNRMGFSHVFVCWIFACVSTSFSFMVNGKACGYVTPSRGIRQGDPLSPYLFLIVFEAFSNLIRQAKNQSKFRGIKISKTAPIVTHLFFADDALLFCEANRLQALDVKNLLDQYCSASGQVVNLEKSSVFFSANTLLDERKKICQILCGIQEKKKIKHLGLPLIIGRSKKEIFSFVVESAEERILNWNSSFLSLAGKEVMIKSVLSTLPNYVMSCYKLPVGVCEAFSKVISNFWWDSFEEGNQKIHWLKWSNMTVPKEYGGLGFKDLGAFNDSLLAKQLWRILTQPNLMMCKLLKAKFCPKGGLLNAVCKPNDSWIWKSLMKAKYVLQLGIRFQIGDGKSIRIWEQPWIPNSLFSIPSRKPDSHLTYTWVSELMHPAGNLWNHDLVCKIFWPHEADAILSIPINNHRERDRITWHLTSDKRFSVQSAYNALINLNVQSQDNAECSTYREVQKKMWKKLWKLKIEGKVKHFIWRCLKGILPSKSQLIHKGADFDPYCLFCGDEVESLEHIFFHCNRAKLVWKIAPVSWDGLKYECNDFNEWWLKLCLMPWNQHVHDRIQLSTYMLWWLWKTRNMWVFQKQKVSEVDLVAFALNEWNGFEAASSSS